MTDTIQPIFESQSERARRWRLILGEDQAREESGEGERQMAGGGMSDRDQAMDEALETLYGGDEGGLDDAAPDVARWLGDIRSYFPESVAHMMQRDALKRVNLKKLLADPAVLEHIEPDLDIVAQILSLNKVMPETSRATAREVVRKVVEELVKRLRYPLEQAVSGSIDRARRTRRPRHHEIDWLRTIHANLKHYQTEQRTIIPEQLLGHGRRRNSLRDVILCIDQSGSMSKSVVYAGVFGSVLASIPALDTKLVAFSTTVVDLTPELHDPVDLLFGVQIGGGTNIDRALAYCQGLITRAEDTVLFLVTDLFEGGNRDSMVQRVARLAADGVQVVVLLALNDQGAPRFERKMAQALVDLGVPSFACTPDQFPDLVAAVLDRRDIRQWAAVQGIVTAPSN